MGRIALFSENKLPISSGKGMETFTNAYTACLRYKTDNKQEK